MVLNSPGYHEIVGVVERVNRTFMEKLRKLRNYGKYNCEYFVEKATQAVNHSSTEVLQFHRIF